MKLEPHLFCLRAKLFIMVPAAKLAWNRGKIPPDSLPAGGMGGALRWCKGDKNPEFLPLTKRLFS
jgi:hypothetical protein